MHRDQRNRHPNPRKALSSFRFFGRFEFEHVKITTSPNVVFLVTLAASFSEGNQLKVLYYFCSRVLLRLAVAVLIFVCGSLIVVSQTEDSFGDAAADPIKLFEQGQSAHARGELEKALDFYERAIQVRPEFPEAEFQRGNALAALGRLPSAHTAFERAIVLRKNWSLPYSALGTLLVKEGKDREAESYFRQALKFDARDNVALRMLAEIRLRSGDSNEALSLARQAAGDPEGSIAAWIVRAMAERATGDRAAANRSLQHVLQVEPENLAALLERAELRLDEADYERASSDLNQALKLRPGDKKILSRLHNQVKARRALEKLLEKNPQNAMLLARLGGSYRTDDPSRSLEYYRRATSIEPDNADYATGYAAALVQARRFTEGTIILRRVITSTPQSYAAHANLATALYELKRYSEALPEYEWLLQAKPDMAVAYYFIATAHDYLGEYPEALTAYETFLVRADPKINQLEIEKVKLRLPQLRRQIQLGQGTKQKNKR